MTRVDFYFNVGDKPQKIMSLTQVALNKQRRVMVYVADEVQAKGMSERLWCDDPSSFLPHELFGDILKDSSVLVSSLALTPILIATTLSNGQEAHLHQDDVLINMQNEHPAFFSRFRQLIELVGIDEIDKVAARLRYKFYRDRGYEIKSIDTNAV